MKYKPATSAQAAKQGKRLGGQVLLKFLLVNSHAVRISLRRLYSLVMWAVLVWNCSPQAGTFAQCQGGSCGVTAWMCCCDLALAEGGQSLGAGPTWQNRGASFQPTFVRAGAVCDPICHCAMVAHSTDKALAPVTPPSPPLLEILAVLPRALLVEKARVAPQAYHYESRGPPADAAHGCSPALRAPPHS